MPAHPRGWGVVYGLAPVSPDQTNRLKRRKRPLSVVTHAVGAAWQLNLAEERGEPPNLSGCRLTFDIPPKRIETVELVQKEE